MSPEILHCQEQYTAYGSVGVDDVCGGFLVKYLASCDDVLTTDQHVLVSFYSTSPARAAQSTRLEHMPLMGFRDTNIHKVMLLGVQAKVHCSSVTSWILCAHEARQRPVAYQHLLETSWNMKIRAHVRDATTHRRRHRQVLQSNC